MPDFLLQTCFSLVLGVLFQGSGFLRLKPLWVGQLAFFALQILQIYYFGLAGIAGLGVVIGLLGGLAVCVCRGSTAGRGFGLAVAVLFAAYMAYWVAEKYVMAIAYHYGVSSAGLFAGFEGIAAPIAIVGISYIGFKLIHFFVDYRAGEVSKFEPFVFLSWLLFAPTIVAGPMQRFEEWQEQFGEICLTADKAIWGLRRILLGLFLKIVLADNIYALTLPQIPAGALPTAPWTSIIGGAVLYSLYLYWDFSGYCEIAIGTGIFWGIRVPENFSNPYFARNLAEFWNRWHMTLSHIVRDYLFYPLTLWVRRRPVLREQRVIATIIPPLLTFIAVGIWHGAARGFVLYGLIQGIGLAYLAVRRVAPGSNSRFKQWWMRSRVGYGCSALLNFGYVTFSFVFFSLPGDKLSILLHRAI